MEQLPFNKRGELLIKADEKISECGCLPHKRSVEKLLEYGIINLDKPTGPTSHQVSESVKSLLKVKKAGHAGTLDPKVSGILPVALNNGTRALQALLSAGKEYLVLMHLHEDVPEIELSSVMKKFTGEIYQKPPLRSAVKRILRIRKIYYIKILEIEDKDVLFKVGCEAGTYMRRLCYDIGAALGCGAHMQQLRRTKMASFDESNLSTLYDVTDAYHFWRVDGNEDEIRKVVLPFESALSHLSRIIISDKAVDPLCHGSQLKIPGILKLDSGIQKQDLVAVFTQKGEAVILGTALKSSDELLILEKGLAVKTIRVLMEPGTYKF